MVVGRALPWKHQTSVAHEQDDVQQTPLEFDASLYRVKEVVGLESRTAIRWRLSQLHGAGEGNEGAETSTTLDESDEPFCTKTDILPPAFSLAPPSNSRRAPTTAPLSFSSSAAPDCKGPTAKSAIGAFPLAAHNRRQNHHNSPNYSGRCCGSSISTRSGASLSASPSVSNALSSAASPSGAAGTTPIKLKPILHLDATIATNNRPAKFLCVQPPPDEQGQRHLQTGLSAMWPSEAQTSASLLLFRPSSRRSRHELMPSSRAA